MGPQETKLRARMPMGKHADGTEKHFNIWRHRGVQDEHVAQMMNDNLDNIAKMAADEAARYPSPPSSRI